ncbi:MAG: hypothetical protein AAGA78_19405, partial [Pseudomonadota bacterium]
MTAAPKVLMCSYGGGHSKVIIPLAKALLDQGFQVDLIGFTTAYQEFLRAGLPARSVETMLDPSADAEYLEMARRLAPKTGHPNITERETLAYTALGLRDLALAHGAEEAEALFKARGRFVFEPVESAKRALAASAPDLVIATTSPRMELAFLRAAKAMGLPNLAIANQFIIDERAWVLSDTYADHLAVMCQEVAESLGPENTLPFSVQVTGSPAFDPLAELSGDTARRETLRKKLGIAPDEVVLLWPLNNATAARTGEAFVPPEKLVEVFENLCLANPRLRYILRKHPNSPDAAPKGMVRGLFDRGEMSMGESLLVADKLCGEMSTVLLEGMLLGKPVACYGFTDYSP